MTAAQRFALALLGHPVSHSLSPAMHAAALAACGFDGSYEAIDTPDRALLHVQLQRIRDGVLHGVNVTIPWKIDVASACDVLIGDAPRVGAVNTAWRDADGRLCGANTDVGGLVAAIAEAFPGRSFQDRPVAVLGAGGAGRSAILAATRLGASNIRVHNRTHARAVEAVTTLGLGVATQALEETLADAALVIQASSAGFRLDPAETEALAATLAAPMALTAPDAVLYDAVYVPSRTAWMVAAETQGRAASDGLGMLVHQAALAFEVWTGRAPPLDIMWAAACARLGRPVPKNV
jgi:shikimate dehydrogenase